jgi:hypothetical protein
MPCGCQRGLAEWGEARHSGSDVRGGFWQYSRIDPAISPPGTPPMRLRGPGERLIQTLCHEAGDGAVPMLALSGAVMIWSPLHNTVFAWSDLRQSGRVASDRLLRWRVVDAASHAGTTVVATLPVPVWLGGHGGRGPLQWTDLPTRDRTASPLVSRTWLWTFRIR